MGAPYTRVNVLFVTPRLISSLIVPATTDTYQNFLPFYPDDGMSSFSQTFFPVPSEQPVPL